jgi:hypothetical protein
MLHRAAAATAYGSFKLMAAVRQCKNGFKPPAARADNRAREPRSVKLSITYSAYRELEMVPQVPLRDIGEAIIGLADDPYPPGHALLSGNGGCYYLAIDDWYILYHIDSGDEALTVLGVVQGPYHPLH